jgi:hypothetical protein
MTPDEESTAAALVPRRTLLLAVALGAIVDVSSNLAFYGLTWARGAALGTIFAVALAAVALAWVGPPRGGPPAGSTLLRLLAFLPPILVGASAIAGYGTRPALAGGEPAFWAVGLAAVALLAALAFARARPATIAGAALAAGLGLRAFTFSRAGPAATGDMLPLVIEAGQRLLHGQSPYGVYEMPWRLPLTYLPLTWLTYLPAVALHVDPRWMSVLCELAVAAVIVRSATRGGPAGGASDHPILLLLAAWYLLPSSLEWVRITAAPPSWAALALVLVTAARDAPSAPVALGVAAATTPLAAVLAPLVVLRWVRQRGWGGTLRAAALAIAVAALLVAPFFLWAPRSFVDGTVLWFNDLDRYPRLRWREARTWREYAGLSGLLWQLGRERWLKPLQGAAVLALALFYRRRGSPAAALVPFGVASLVLFMIANPVVWAYYHAPAVIAGLVAVAAAGRDPVREHRCREAEGDDGGAHRGPTRRN